MDKLRRNPRTLAFASLLVVFTLAVGVGITLVPNTADAVPLCGTHVKYYSDASHTTQVGLRYFDCDSVLQYSWGIITQWHSVEIYCCIIE